MKYISAKYIVKRLPLILLILALSYCTLLVGGYSYLEQLEDDEFVGKTLLIYPSTGQFVPDEDWYFGKKTGDSWFSDPSSPPEYNVPPNLYRIVGYYKEAYQGGALLAGDGLTKYLIEPISGKTDKRLFFSSLFLCDAQTNLNDPETGIKIDFICD